ncbi:hypothetical protein F6A13_12030 [Acidithiobacillus sp. 'AMD consortium']|uniref:hypothetical protein n=1 Tax=Acidithiobacillus sp. 'AMD consortium' TaxID=2614801 RepID=UPI00124EF10C|nr:hypothetical protein [Acidithiobacillus sp. 'AMD consortium']QFG79261.1 hypothetical protein F6A13_12030 [Acidithiobacillus sp. 'AMD consortium']
MHDNMKFYLAVGGVAVVILGIGFTTWEFDFAPKTPHPATNPFASTAPVRAVRSAPSGTLPPATPPTRWPTASAPTAAGTVSVVQTAPMPATPATGVTASVTSPAAPDLAQAMARIGADLRVLATAQRHTNERLAVVDQEIRSKARSTPGTHREPPRRIALASAAQRHGVPGWSVESIGANEAWIQGPGGQTHVVEAGSQVEDLRILRVTPDAVITSQGTIGY